MVALTIDGRLKCCAAICAVLVCSAGTAFGKDDSESDKPEAKTAFPTTYLDLRTTYATIPANTLSIGFGGSSILAALPTLSSPSAKSVTVDVPLTVDVTDQVSVYGGISASTAQVGAASWTTLAVSSWNIGIQAEVYQQDGGSIPTITVQSTLTRSVPDGPLATTSLNTIIESDYALNADETRGLLAGIQYTRVAVDTPFVNVHSAIVGYVGAYYQWDNNWKLTGRAGVQSFGGAQLLNQTPIAPFTQPVIRIDLDRMDDNDNRLFGLTGQIAWTPKPSYQITARTPLYLVKN